MFMSQTNAVPTYDLRNQLGQTAGPRPLGYLEQLSGIVSGLDEISLRLELLASKIAGTPAPTGDGGQRPASAGMQGLIQDANDRIGNCRALLSGFEQSF